MDEITITHRIGAEINNPTDAVSKELHIAKLSNGGFHLHLITIGKDGEKPVRTELGLSTKSMELLQAITFDVLHNLSRYEVKDVATQSQDNKANEKD